jgi:hypothetical protein
MPTYSCSEGDPTDKNRASPPVARQEQAQKQQYNCQNDKIYAQTSREAKEKIPRVHRSHHPAYVMIWWGVSHHGVTPLHFCKKGVKTGAPVYQENVLQGVVKPLNTTPFNGQKWAFLEDSAPAHETS